MQMGPQGEACLFLWSGSVLSQIHSHICSLTSMLAILPLMLQTSTLSASSCRLDGSGSMRDARASPARRRADVLRPAPQLQGTQFQVSCSYHKPMVLEQIYASLSVSVSQWCVVRHALPLECGCHVCLCVALPQSVWLPRRFTGKLRTQHPA